jgi:hypothetical protein
MPLISACRGSDAAFFGMHGAEPIAPARRFHAISQYALTASLFPTPFLPSALCDSCLIFRAFELSSHSSTAHPHGDPDRRRSFSRWPRFLRGVRCRRCTALTVEVIKDLLDFTSCTEARLIAPPLSWQNVEPCFVIQDGKVTSRQWEKTPLRTGGGDARAPHRGVG